MIPKFRAWDKELQTMLDVSLIDLKKGVLVGEHWEFGETNFMSFDEIELMQSTGLFDKNNKEIFEGDVVSIDTDEFDLLFVKYESGIYWLMDDEECVEHLSDYYKYVSIVGNIYENPELLEDGK